MWLQNLGGYNIKTSDEKFFTNMHQDVFNRNRGGAVVNHHSKVGGFRSSKNRENDDNEGDGGGGCGGAVEEAYNAGGDNGDGSGSSGGCGGDGE